MASTGSMEPTDSLELRQQGFGIAAVEVPVDIGAAAAVEGLRIVG